MGAMGFGLRDKMAAEGLCEQTPATLPDLLVRAGLPVRGLYQPCRRFAQGHRRIPQPCAVYVKLQPTRMRQAAGGIYIGNGAVSPFELFSIDPAFNSIPNRIVALN